MDLTDISELRFQQQLAQRVLTQFQEHPESWTRVPFILEQSSNPQSKVRRRVTLPFTPSPSVTSPDRLALRDPANSRLILVVYRVADTGKAHQHKMENPTRGTTARYVTVYLIFGFGARGLCRGAYYQSNGDVTLTLWSLGIRNFTISVTVRIASEEVNLRRERAYLNKLNLALVQVRDYGFSVFNLCAVFIIERGPGRSSSKSGRTTGQTSYLNSSNRPRRVCRCAKTTWSSSGFYQKRFSTSPLSK